MRGSGVEAEMGSKEDVPSHLLALRLMVVRETAASTWESCRHCGILRKS